MSKAIGKLIFSEQDIKMLRAIKKRRRLTCRDFDWWSLIGLMKMGAIHKVVSEKGAGWPHFVISPRGKAILRRLNKAANQNRNNG